MIELNKLYLGDCIEVMKGFDDNCIDSIVTDPPYGLEFMGKEWDKLQTAQWTGKKEDWQDNHPENHIAQRISKMPRYYAGKEMQNFHYQWANECLRILKPGGHLLSFGGTRTYHRMVCAIEDAGFEIRDCLQWIYGSGFPKNLNLGDGMGTALKPAVEMIVLARKPISEKNIAENVLKWGTGGIAIDKCRIGTNEILSAEYGQPSGSGCYNWNIEKKNIEKTGKTNLKGRWPANVIFDEEAAELLDEQSGQLDQCGGEKKTTHDKGIFGIGQPGKIYREKYRGASRFFYVAKASKSERNAGLEGFETKAKCEINKMGGSKCTMKTGSGNERNVKYLNNHPTVKPIKLMRYLVRLITPPGGVCLDPFIGSGTTAIACIEEGFDYIGIEKEKDYFDIAEKRIFHYKRQLKLF